VSSRNRGGVPLIIAPDAIARVASPVVGGDAIGLVHRRYPDSLAGIRSASKRTLHAGAPRVPARRTHHPHARRSP